MYGLYRNAGLSTVKRGVDSYVQAFPKAISSHLFKHRKPTQLQLQQITACSSSLIDSSSGWGLKRKEQAHIVSLIRTCTLSQNHIPSSPLASSPAGMECRGIWWQTGSPYCTGTEIPEPDSIRERCHPWPGQAYLCACSLHNKDVNKHCYPHRSSTVISIRQSSDRKPRPVFFPAMLLPLTPAARAWGDFLY